MWAGITVLAMLVGFGGGIYLANNRAIDPTEARVEVRENSNTFHFINPLLECELGSSYLKGNSLPDQGHLQQIIDNAKAQGKISFVSLYYRDLNNGPWVGINESEKFFPASLMKIPLMFHFYKEAETDPGILARKITFNSSEIPVTVPYYPPPVQLEDGKEYTVEELIEHALRYSDNNAAALLFREASNENLNSLYADLHITLPTDDSGTDFMTARTYATFFRVLYNSSYLTNEHSEQALGILTQSSFNQGMTAKLPPNVIVAHKFGEKAYIDNASKQLHDCGIVYVPGKPYLFCVMTRGNNMDEMANFIGDLSRAVYDDVTR
jgi:beta-lactamase class A